MNVTPNRPDALSHLGIAREVAAATGATVVYPEPGLRETAPPASASLRVSVEAPGRCFRYAARVVEGVRIGPSPAWLRQRLEACGVRSISNVVDVTNFVLLERGQPLHAFDLDKVAGAEIVVRMARAGEKMVTLDGVERTLSPDDLVIADRDRASALAGVMGGGIRRSPPGPPVCWSSRPGSSPPACVAPPVATASTPRRRTVSSVASIQRASSRPSIDARR